MPADLENRLVQTAAFMAPSPAPAEKAVPRAAGESPLGWIVAGVAAAAALIMMVSMVFSQPDSTTVPVPEVAAVDFEQSADDLVKADWKTVQSDFADVSGYVSWSKAEQNGYMHLKGLPVNDVSKAQYQLWIVDGKREGAPVDGGRF